MQDEITSAEDTASSIKLARRLHDTIAQRLTGLSCFLGEVDGPTPDGALDRCRDEIHAAIDELREVLDSVGRARPIRLGQFEAQVAALCVAFPNLQLDWHWTPDADDDSAPLVNSFLVEALCNIRKHAQPTRVAVEVQYLIGATVVSVTNDGVLPQSGRGTRQGSRLLALEATAQGAITDSHPQNSGRWRQRLIMPSRQVDTAA